MEVKRGPQSLVWILPAAIIGAILLMHLVLR